MARVEFNPCEIVFVINGGAGPATVTVTDGSKSFTLELDGSDAAYFVSAFRGAVEWDENTHPDVVVHRVKLDGCGEVT